MVQVWILAMKSKNETIANMYDFCDSYPIADVERSVSQVENGIPIARLHHGRAADRRAQHVVKQRWNTIIG